MYNEYSEARVNALTKARQYYHYGSSNPLYTDWRVRAIESFAFYDGDGQYPLEVIKELKKRNQAPIVINKVKSMINNISGIERKNRVRTAFRPHSFSIEEKKLTTALTHLGYFVQENQDVPQKRSDRNKDSLICGIGWNGISYPKGQVLFENIHPLSIIYDADDFSPRMTNQKYCIRLHWMGKDELKILYPKFSKKIDSLFVNAEPANVGSYTAEFFNRISEFVDTFAISGQGVGGKILIIELQRKEARKYLKGMDYAGNEFQTFDEKLAEELSPSKNDIEEEMGHQIIRTVFCGDLVLEHAPLKPNIPNLTDFLYIPCVYGRRSSDGVLDGWLTPMKDIQRLVNFNKLKETAMLNSKFAIIDSTAFIGQTIEDMREQLSRSDGIIIKNPESQVTLHDNMDLAAAQINSARRLDEELQQVSGMFADALGAPTNATSGVAINSRARLSITNQQLGFDMFDLANKREARMMLNLIQGGAEENIYAQILTPEEEEELVLNLSVVKDGKKMVYNDIRTLPVSIYVETTHDYESAPEEKRAVVEAVLAHQAAQTILQSPSLLELMDVPQGDKIAEEMQKITQQKYQMEQMSNAGTPIPPQQPIDQSPFAGITP